MFLARSFTALLGAGILGIVGVGLGVEANFTDAIGSPQTITYDSPPVTPVTSGASSSKLKSPTAVKTPTPVKSPTAAPTIPVAPTPTPSTSTAQTPTPTP